MGIAESSVAFLGRGERRRSNGHTTSGGNEQIPGRETGLASTELSTELGRKQGWPEIMAATIKPSSEVARYIGPSIEVEQDICSGYLCKICVHSNASLQLFVA